MRGMDCTPILMSLQEMLQHWNHRKCRRRQVCCWGEHQLAEKIPLCIKVKKYINCKVWCEFGAPACVFRELETDCYQLKILETALPGCLSPVCDCICLCILSLAGRPGGDRFTNTPAGCAKFTPNLAIYVQIHNLFSKFENMNFQLHSECFSKIYLS